MDCEQISFKTCKSRVGSMKIEGDDKVDGHIRVVDVEYMFHPSPSISFNTLESAKEVALGILAMVEELE